MITDIQNCVDTMAEETPRSAASHASRRRMAQNYLLIWLDSHIDESIPECRDTLLHLRRIVTDVNTFTQPAECVQFLRSIPEEKAFLIVSGTLGQQLIPNVHTLPQVDRIYLFCRETIRDQRWTKQWTKVTGVYESIGPICDALQGAVKQTEHDSIPVSFVAMNEEASVRNLDRLEPTFMYTQIFKEILLELDYDETRRKALVEHCRRFYRHSYVQLKIIDEFEREYHRRSAIWWYTRECFTYQMLNRALRVFDADTVVSMGFFVRDLHRQIEELHRQQTETVSKDRFIVYRGQGLSQSDFEQLKATKGGLMCFNNFLSTSRNREVSYRFAERSPAQANTVGVLFRMSVDPSTASIPFASVREVSFFQNEDEILFSMHAVFRVGDIQPIDADNRTYQVNLTLTADDDAQLRMLTDRIRTEVVGFHGWGRLSHFLITSGHFDKAEELCRALLEQTTDDQEQALYYNNLGYCKEDQGDNEQALRYYEKALEIYRKILPPDSFAVATAYSNIGLVHLSLGNSREALEFLQRDLDIQQRTNASDHLNLASSYNNLGGVYKYMGEHSTALTFYNQGLEMTERLLPDNHPSLATSCNNIACLHYAMGNYPRAIPFFQRALDISRRSLPPSHPNLKDLENNIAVLQTACSTLSAKGHA